MRRARNPSPPPFFDELLHRYTQNPAFAEFHKPFDCFATAVRVDALDRDQPSDWFAVLCYRDLLAPLDALQQRREMGFRLVGTDLCGHSPIPIWSKTSLILALAAGKRHRPRQSANGSRTRTVSSRSGLVDSIATGAPISSSGRRMYLIAVAGRSAQDRAPRVLSPHPSALS